MFVVSDGVSVEWVGNDALVMRQHDGSSDVLRISGRLAETLLAISRGDVVSSDTAEVRELSLLGLVSPYRQGLSRRAAIGAGATLGVAGMAMITLPSAAAALSTDALPEAPAGIPVPVPASPNEANDEILITRVAESDSQDSEFSLLLPVARIQNWNVIEAWLTDPSRDRRLQVGNFGLAGISRRYLEFVLVGGAVTAVESVENITISDFTVVNQLTNAGTSTIQLRLRDLTDGTESGEFSTDFAVGWPAYNPV